MRSIKVLGCAVLSGCLLGLALPPYRIHPLGWMALVPLFAAVRGSKLLIGFSAGLLAALVPAFLLAKGLVPVPDAMPGDESWIYGGYLLFGALLAVMGGIIADAKPFGLRKAVQLSALAVLFEYGLKFLLPEHLALTMSNFRPALGVASVTGIWGVSFLVWFFNLSVAVSLGDRARLARLFVGWAFASLAGSLAFALQSGVGPAGPKVAVIQTEITDLASLAALNREALNRGALLAIWPELSGTGTVYAGDTRELMTLSAKPGEAAFVTTFEDGLLPKPHNTASLFDHGAESARYFKRKPFAGEAANHEAGVGPMSAAWRSTVGLNICYDSCYPDVMRDTANLEGVKFIALPTLDPLSRGGVVQSMHAAYTPFRAAELGIGIARADVSGYSMIVGPDGEPRASLGVGDGIAVASIPGPHVTIYRRLGDWFVVLCALVVAAFMADGLRRRKA